MNCKGLVRYCEPDKGQSIGNFAEEVIKHRDTYGGNYIIMFNDTYIYVDKTMTANDVFKHYINIRDE